MSNDKVVDEPLILVSSVNAAQAESYILRTVLVVGAALFAAALSCGPSPSNDLFWQLRAGHDVLLTHSPPYHDSYSWSASRGTPWVAHEWLSFVVFWLVYKFSSGFVGLDLFKFVLIGAIISVFQCSVTRSSGNKLIPAYLFTVAASYPISVGLEIRPQLFTYLFLTVTSAVVIKQRNSQAKKWHIWLLVPLYILWANLHSGVYVGVLLLAIWSVGDLIDGYLGRDSESAVAARNRWAQMFSVALTCFLGTLINPYGLSEILNMVQTVSNHTAMSFVTEWASPSIRNETGQSLALLSAICIFGMIYSNVRVRLGDFIVVAVTLYLAMYSIRNVPVFGIAAGITSAPYVFSSLFRLLRGIGLCDDDKLDKSIFGSAPQHLIVYVGVVEILCLGLFCASLKVTPDIDWFAHPLESPLERLAAANLELSANPVQATAALRSGVIPKNWKMDNTYNEGGYLIWSLPQYQVSIDSRADVYFGSVLDSYFRLNKWPDDLKDQIPGGKADFVVTEPNQEKSRIFMSSSEWALIYVDNPDLDYPYWSNGSYNTMIFVRRSKTSEAMIAKMRARCPGLHSSEFMNLYHWYPAVH